MTLTIVLPTKNEEESIWKTISDIRKHVVCPIVVVDAHSTDDTAILASLHRGVTVIFDEGKGKGAALRQAFEYCGTDVIFLDVDGTYEIGKIGEFVTALDNGYDVVVGEKHYTRAVKPRILGIGLFTIGDWIWRVAFSLFYGKSTANNISGYRGMKKSVIDMMDLQEDGFGIETEIEVKTIKLGVTEKIIDTIYDDRVGESKFRLKDNLATAKAFFKYMFWRRSK